MATPGNDVVIRRATPADVSTILALIKELALYEHQLDKVLATEESLRQSLTFDLPSSNIAGHGYARTILILENDEPAGMALYFYNYSTWTARPGIYLEDLFVRPEHRGKGYGQRLLGEMARELVEIGGTRLEWRVLNWNEPSIKFYENLGAKPLSEWTTMRVDGEALVELAKKGKGIVN